MKAINPLFLKKLFCLTLLINMFLAGSVATAAVQHPNTLINADELTAIKAKVVAGVAPWKSAYDKMINQANSAMSLPDMSVTFGGKNFCGSNNIFCTEAFYDEGSDRYDWEQGAKPIGIGVRDLGMAYAFTGDARYADKLIRLVRVWAIDPETAMQPRFGNSQGRMDTYGTMTGLIYGVDLAWNYPDWTQADKDVFKAWVQTFGENANAFSTSPNNFENWRNAFVSIAGAFTGDQTLLNDAFQKYRDAIPAQIHWTGRMNQEYGRTNGWGGLGYSIYALHAMIQTAEVARHHGVDLYNYNFTYTVDGEIYRKGLKVALDFHVPYLMDPSSWKWGIGTNTINERSGVGIYELAYSVWQDEPNYLNVVNRWERPMGMNMWALGVVTLTHANRFDLTLEPTPPSIVTPPESVTVTEGKDASFSVVAMGSDPLSYQWFGDGNAIADATNANYTLTGVSSSDNGRIYHSEVSNSQGNVSSDGAVLTVLSDTIAPTLESVFAASDTRVDIVFSEPVSISSAEDSANYQIDLGIAVTSASLSDGGLSVSLSVSPLTVDTTYTVQVSHVQDLAQNPNTIVALSSKTFTYRTANGFEEGTAEGWTPLTPSRWSVVMDEGDKAYYLNTTAFNNFEVGRLGEYSLLSAEPGDFTFTMQARLGDDVASNTFADYAVVFGFQDENNYYYAMFNNTQSATQLARIVDGSRTELVTADIDWLTDNLYHNVEVSRIGSDISVRFDGNLIMSANDSTFGAGNVGVGSYNDSAYFDDVSLIAAQIADTIVPLITLRGDNPQTITVGNAYTELGATAIDNRDGNINDEITIDFSAVDTTTVGSYSIHYNVSDVAGNPATEVIRMVNVIAMVDNVIPVITLIGNNSQTITVGNAYLELGASAFDNVDGDISTNITIDSSAVDTGVVGSYSVRYSVSDAAGNPATEVIRMVSVTVATVNEPDDSDESGGGGGLGPLLGFGAILLAFRSRRQHRQRQPPPLKKERLKIGSNICVDRFRPTEIFNESD